MNKLPIMFHNVFNMEGKGRQRTPTHILNKPLMLIKEISDGSFKYCRGRWSRHSYL